MMPVFKGEFVSQFSLRFSKPDFQKYRARTGACLITFSLLRDDLSITIYNGIGCVEFLMAVEYRKRFDHNKLLIIKGEISDSPHGQQAIPDQLLFARSVVDRPQLQS